jgi:hypothetical protein
MIACTVIAGSIAAADGLLGLLPHTASVELLLLGLAADDVQDAAGQHRTMPATDPPERGTRGARPCDHAATRQRRSYLAGIRPVVA